MPMLPPAISDRTFCLFCGNVGCPACEPTRAQQDRRRAAIQEAREFLDRETEGELKNPLPALIELVRSAIEHGRNTPLGTTKSPLRDVAPVTAAECTANRFERIEWEHKEKETA